MRIRVDKESNALYLRISEDKIVESEEIAPGIVIDYGENGRSTTVKTAEFWGWKSSA